MLLKPLTPFKRNNKRKRRKLLKVLKNLTLKLAMETSLKTDMS
jgi:hypothetical protein